MPRVNDSMCVAKDVCTSQVPCINSVQHETVLRRESKLPCIDKSLCIGNSYCVISPAEASLQPSTVAADHVIPPSVVGPQREAEACAAAAVRAVGVSSGACACINYVDVWGEPVFVACGDHATDTRNVFNVCVDPVWGVPDARLANDVGRRETELKSSIESGAQGIPAERVVAMDELLERSSQHLSAQEKEEVRALLYEYHAVFSITDEDVGRTTYVKHTIETGDARPIKIPPRRIPLAKREIVDAEIARLLRLGLIRESSSPWAAPIVLVERNEKHRLCVDYRALNNVTKKDAFPVERPDAIFDALTGSKYFSGLDLRNGYNQIEMLEEHEPKTAFCVEDGLYEFNVMSFGLTNSGASCNRLISSVFRGMPRDKLVTFVDDIMVHAVTVAQEIENLREAFSRLLKAGLKLNLQKCKLFQIEISFLGHVVSGDGIRTDPKKVEAVQNWPVPRSVSQVRSFVGLITYYRRFVKDFSQIARPLYELTRKRVRFVWGSAQQAAFDELKRRLVTAPILCLPEPEGEWILDTDASLHGIGSVLSQRVNGQERVIAYFSRVLSPAERNYCVTRCELLAMVKSLTNFHVYLYDRRLTLRTDHSSMTWLTNFRSPEGQRAR